MSYEGNDLGYEMGYDGDGVESGVSGVSMARMDSAVGYFMIDPAAAAKKPSTLGSLGKPGKAPRMSTGSAEADMARRRRAEQDAARAAGTGLGNVEKVRPPVATALPEADTVAVGPNETRLRQDLEGKGLDREEVDAIMRLLERRLSSKKGPARDKAIYQIFYDEKAKREGYEASELPTRQTAEQVREGIAEELKWKAIDKIRADDNANPQTVYNYLVAHGIVDPERSQAPQKDSQWEYDIEVDDGKGGKKVKKAHIADQWQAKAVPSNKIRFFEKKWDQDAPKKMAADIFIETEAELASQASEAREKEKVAAAAEPKKEKTPQEARQAARKARREERQERRSVRQAVRRGEIADPKDNGRFLDLMRNTEIALLAQAGLAPLPSFAPDQAPVQASARTSAASPTGVSQHQYTTAPTGPEESPFLPTTPIVQEESPFLPTDGSDKPAVDPLAAKLPAKADKVELVPIPDARRLLENSNSTVQIHERDVAVQDVATKLQQMFPGLLSDSDALVMAEHLHRQEVGDSVKINLPEVLKARGYDEKSNQWAENEDGSLKDPVQERLDEIAADPKKLLKLKEDATEAQLTNLQSNLQGKEERDFYARPKHVREFLKEKAGFSDADFFSPGKIQAVAEPKTKEDEKKFEVMRKDFAKNGKFEAASKDYEDRIPMDGMSKSLRAQMRADHAFKQKSQKESFDHEDKQQQANRDHQTKLQTDIEKMRQEHQTREEIRKAAYQLALADFQNENEKERLDMQLCANAFNGLAQSCMGELTRGGMQVLAAQQQLTNEMVKLPMVAEIMRTFFPALFNGKA